MIEISHQHARRLLRASLDGRIPDEQWTAVQTHIENCAECRAYRTSVIMLERDARKSLRGHWEGIQGPRNEILPEVQARRQMTALRRKIGVRAAAASAVLALFWFLGGTAWITEMFAFAPSQLAASSDLQRSQDPILPTLTPLPAAQPGQVQALVVFSARSAPEADSNIYLMNPPEMPEALVESTANETQPAWSPDGEWVAYLSDAPGKTEVYMISLTGGKPIQVTTAPGIEWYGPITFSPDGANLALTGVRPDQGRQSWIYLLPTAGGEPVALPGTRGGWAPEFSPAGERLAFTIVEGQNHGAAVYYFQRPESALLRSPRHWTSPAGQGAPIGEGVFHFQPEGSDFAALADSSLFRAGLGLDWSPDGTGLAYLGTLPENQGGGSRVMVEREMDYATSLHDDYQLVTQVAQSRWQGAFQAVSFTPSGAVLFLEDLDDARANDQPGTTPEACWTINLRDPLGSQRLSQTSIAPKTGGLCVESGLDRTAWTGDGKWVIVVGRSPADLTRALFAVRMPGWFDSPFVATPTPEPVPEDRERWQAAEPGDALHLADADGMFNANQLTGTPRVRPAGSPRKLAIQPVPSTNPAPMLPATTGLIDAPGEIVYAIRNNTSSLIIRARPNGNSGRVLAANTGSNRCPRFSPDGQWVAFISNHHPDAIGGGSDLSPENASLSDGLYRMQASDGSQLSRLTLASDRPSETPPNEALNYGCPVWSPTGAYLAAAVAVEDKYYLAITPASPAHERKATATFLPIGQPTGAPTWTSDGARIALAYADANGKPILLVATVRPAEEPLEGKEANISVTYTSGAAAGFRITSGPVISNDGWQVYLLSNVQRPEEEPYAILRRISLEGIGERMPLPLGPDAPRQSVPGTLARLEGWNFGVILRGGMEDHYKTYLHTYDLLSHKLGLLAAFEDEIYSAIWAPTGDWVMLSMESGLWAVNIHETGQTAPVWISPEPVFDLDWRVDTQTASLITDEPGGEPSN